MPGVAGLVPRGEVETGLGAVAHLKHHNNVIFVAKNNKVSCRGTEPGPFNSQSSTLPLS